MDVFRTENNCLKFHYDAEELWIQPWGANSFRIRATKLAEMPKENWALEMPVEDIVPKIQIEEKRASIINGKIKAVISSYGKLTIYNSKEIVLMCLLIIVALWILKQESLSQFLVETIIFL